jgi:hypothetical protein
MRGVAFEAQGQEKSDLNRMHATLLPAWCR